MKIHPLALAISQLLLTAAGTAHATDYTGPLIANKTNGNLTLNAGDTVTSNGNTTFNSAIQAQQGATVEATDVTVTTTGDTAHAAFAEGGTITMKGGSLSFEPALPGNKNSDGARAENGGKVNLTDTAVKGASVVASKQGTIEITRGSLSGGGLVAMNGSSRITATDLTIDAGVGALAQVGTNTIVINGGKINATGRGVYSNGAGGRIDLSDASKTTIEVSGDQSYGAWALSGGLVEFGGDSVTTQGNKSYGFYALNKNSTIKAVDTEVLTQGSDSYAAYAQTSSLIDGNRLSLHTLGSSATGAKAYGGIVTLSESEVVTEGGDSIGLHATGTSATRLTADAVHVKTSGASASGAVADNGALVTLRQGSKVETSGAKGTGLLAWIGGRLEATDTTVATQGNKAPGAMACSATTIAACSDDLLGKVKITEGAPAVLTIDSATVSTKGTSAYGLYAFGQGADFTADTVKVETSGDASYAAVVRNGGALKVKNSTLTTSGANAAGVYMTSPAGMAGKADLNNVEIKASQGESIVVDRGAAAITLEDTRAIENNGTWLRVAASDAANPAIADVQAVSSTFSGAALTSAGATTNVALNNGTVWDMTGNSNVTRLTNDASLIQFAAPVGAADAQSSYKTLTAVNYSGNGGTIGLHTYLAGDGSASDRLVIDGGAASGHTLLKIGNTGGGGAPTQGDGIEVVSALNGATTTAQTTKDAFALAGGHVDAGAYEYRLYAADANGEGENWYLRSTVVVSPEPKPGSKSETETKTETVSEPAPIAKAEPIVVPTYRAEVPLLAALPAQLRRADLAMLGNLHQRIGDDDVKGAAASSTNDRERRAWGRVISADLDIRQEGTVSPESKGRLNGFQAGTDLWANQNWRTGVYTGQLEGDASVHGFARGIAKLGVGSTDLRSQYLGAYGTYTSGSGFYADAVLQAGRHSYTAFPQSNAQASGSGSSLLASLEVGQAFALSERWKIEPQLQLVNQKLSLDDTAITGALVQQKTDSNWLLRAGVRVKGEIDTDAGMLQPYARFNVYRASGGHDVTRFIGAAASTDIVTRRGYTSTELAAGATLQLSPTTSVYGEVGSMFAAGGGSQKVKSGLQGSVGLRVRW